MSSTPLQLGVGAYERQYGRMPEVELVNRFFEQDPTNTRNGVALLTRPATKELASFGQGPIRQLFSIEGAFGSDLFVVSNESLFRWDGSTTISIAGNVQGSGAPDMTIVTGPGFERLFIADGLNLQYYDGPAPATAVLTLTIPMVGMPPFIDTQRVRIGPTYYQWASDISSPLANGTELNPFLIALGADDEGSLENLFKAINASGVAGTDYSATIGGANALVIAISSDATTLIINSRARDAGANLIVTETTGADIAFGAATMQGGGTQALVSVNVPDGQAVVSVTSLDGFVIFALANSQRWFFIRPGEVTVGPLDFFSAESEPDEIIVVRQIGDVVVFFGRSSIETWGLTGQVTEVGDAFLPFDGAAFSIGVFPGTVVKIKDFLMFVGSDNIPYRMSGSPEPIPNNGISERIRVARAIEQENA